MLQKLLLVRYCLPQYPLLNLLIFSPQSGASYLMLREEKNHLFNRTSICTINAFMPSCPSEKNNNKETKKKHIVPSCFKQMRSFITIPKFRQTLHKSCTEKLENLPRTVVTLKETWYCNSYYHSLTIYLCF